MRKSDGFPNRLRTAPSIPDGQRQSGFSERSKKSAFDLVVAFCAVAGLILGVVNFIRLSSCERRAMSENSSMENESLDEVAEKHSITRRALKAVRKGAESARPALHERRDALRHIPSTGEIDLGTHVEVVLPK